MPSLWEQNILQTLEEYGPKPFSPDMLEIFKDSEGTAMTLFNCTAILNEISTIEGLKRIVNCRSAEKAKNLLFTLYDFMAGLDAPSNTLVIKNILELKAYDAFRLAIDVLIECHLLDKPHGLDNFSYLVLIEPLNKFPDVANMLYRYKQENSGRITQPQFETFKNTHAPQSTNPFRYFSQQDAEMSQKEQTTMRPLIEQ